MIVNYFMPARELNESDFARIFHDPNLCERPDRIAEFECEMEYNGALDNVFIYRFSSTDYLNEYLDAYPFQGALLFVKTDNGWDCYMACKRKWVLMSSNIQDTIFDDCERSLAG